MLEKGTAREFPVTVDTFADLYARIARLEDAEGRLQQLEARLAEAENKNEELEGFISSLACSTELTRTRVATCDPYPVPMELTLSADKKTNKAELVLEGTRNPRDLVFTPGKVTGKWLDSNNVFPSATFVCDVSAQSDDPDDTRWAVIYHPSGVHYKVSLSRPSTNTLARGSCTVYLTSSV